MLPSLKSWLEDRNCRKTEATDCKYEHFLRELKKLLKEAKIIDGY